MIATRATTLRLKQPTCFFSVRLAFPINAHQNANQKPIGSAPSYRAQCTLPPQPMCQTLLFDLVLVKCRQNVANKLFITRAFNSVHPHTWLTALSASFRHIERSKEVEASSFCEVQNLHYCCSGCWSSWKCWLCGTSSK